MKQKLLDLKKKFKIYWQKNKLIFSFIFLHLFFFLIVLIFFFTKKYPFYFLIYYVVTTISITIFNLTSFSAINHLVEKSKARSSNKAKRTYLLFWSLRFIFLALFLIIIFLVVKNVSILGLLLGVSFSLITNFFIIWQKIKTKTTT